MCSVKEVEQNLFAWVKVQITLIELIDDTPGLAHCSLIEVQTIGQFSVLEREGTIAISGLDFFFFIRNSKQAVDQLLCFLQGIAAKQAERFGPRGIAAGEEVEGILIVQIKTAFALCQCPPRTPEPAFQGEV